MTKIFSWALTAFVVVGLVAGVIYPQQPVIPVGGGDDPVVGGLSLIRIGSQVVWTTDLVPSTSFTPNLGSSARPVGAYFGNSASLSANFEVDGTASVGGNFFGFGTGSNSFAGSLNLSKSLTVTKTGTFSGTGSSSFAGSLDITKSLRVTKNITGVAQIIGDILRGVSRLVVPNSAGITTPEAGAIGVDTASGSFNHHDGFNSRSLGKCDRSPTYMLKGTDLSAKNQWTIHLASWGPMRVKEVAVTASGSNSATWQLLTGSATVPISDIGTHQASGSAIVKYTSFTTSSISMGQKLDLRVTSASATLESVLVQTCLQYDTTE